MDERDSETPAPLFLNQEKYSYKMTLNVQGGMVQFLSMQS